MDFLDHDNFQLKFLSQSNFVHDLENVNRYFSLNHYIQLGNIKH
jgi:hypothetical protein